MFGVLISRPWSRDRWSCGARPRVVAKARLRWSSGEGARSRFGDDGLVLIAYRCPLDPRKPVETMVSIVVASFNLQSSSN